VIWFDVSEILRWYGPQTGIQRVTSEIIRNLIKKNVSIGLVHFDSLTQSFLTVDPGDFLEIADSGSTIKYLRQRSMLSYYFFISENYIKRYFKGLIPTRHHFQLILAYRKLKLGLKAIARNLFVPQSKILKAPFSPGSMLICLGVTWGEDNFFGILDDIKNIYGFKLAHLVHDIIPLRFDNLFTKRFGIFFSNHLEAILEKSDIVLVYSENTKKDLETFCDSTHRSYPAFRKFKLGSSDIKWIEPRPVPFVSSEFCLMVGTVEVRKNHILLIKVWERLLTNLKEKCPTLVIVGREGWLAEEALDKLRRNDPAKTKILWLPYCYDDQLFWLYKNCLFTLYPSLYEGWGLPVGESLAFGKFCIASSASAIPEAGGAFCDYHNPHSVEDCLQLIQKYCLNRELLREKTEYIVQSYQTVSWRESAITLLQAIDYQPSG
jgi:glycosyltransferase involved in cell wall biosynthesis